MCIKVNSFQYPQLCVKTMCASCTVSQQPILLSLHFPERNAGNEHLCHQPDLQYYQVSPKTTHTYITSHLHRSYLLMQKHIFPSDYHPSDMQFYLSLPITYGIFCRLTSVCLLIDLHLAKFHTQPSIQKQKRKNRVKQKGKRKTQNQRHTSSKEWIEVQF